MRIACFFVLYISLMLPFGAHANMRTYTFTSKFIECVKKFDVQNNQFSMPGKSDSSLMNGTDTITVSGGKPSNYWSYMNCLSLAEGGTSSSVLDTADTCPEYKTTIMGVDIYLPPSRQGKRVGVRGRFFVCQSGNWSMSNGDVSIPGGGVIEEISQPESCPQKNYTLNSCSFTLSEASNGESVSDRYGPVYGDKNATSEGSVRAICSDGNFIVTEKTCRASTCTSGQEMVWQGRSSDGRMGYCKGEVAHDGFASSVSVTRRYFSNLITAKLNTVSVSGTAVYLCDQGQWKLDADSPSTYCDVKSQDDLICDSVTSESGATRYYCE